VHLRAGKGTRVAICSGNHDNAGRQISADLEPYRLEYGVRGGELGDVESGVDL